MPRSFLSKVILAGDAAQMCGGLREVNFGPYLNILAGPNGSGKSTILRVVRDDTFGDNNGCQVHRTGEANLEWVAFDGEMDNPRAKHGQGPLQFVNSAGSHGEVQKRTYAYIGDRLRPGMLMLLDEPEAAMDLDGVNRLSALITKRRDVQWVVATHSPFLWGMARLEGARLIELKGGYVQAAMSRYRSMMGA